MSWLRPESLLGKLLLFLGLPLSLLWAFSVLNSYVSALNAATQAYDRTLLASARIVAERLNVQHGELQADVPWVVLDSVERNMNDRLYYKVKDTRGRVISGYDDLPPMPGGMARTDLYPALAWFYHATYQGQRLRVARLLQPVNEGGVVGMAEIYVAETLQSRHLLARQLLISSALSQGGLVLLTLVLAGLLLRRVLKPMRKLSRLMVRRAPGELTPLPDLLPWSETRLLIIAFNRYMSRLRALISPPGALQRRRLASVKNAAGRAENPGGCGAGEPGSGAVARKPSGDEHDTRSDYRSDRAVITARDASARRARRDARARCGGSGGSGAGKLFFTAAAGAQQARRSWL